MFTIAVNAYHVVYGMKGYVLKNAMKNAGYMNTCAYMIPRVVSGVEHSSKHWVSITNTPASKNADTVALH